MNWLNLSALLPLALGLFVPTSPGTAAPANDHLSAFAELPPSGPATPGSNVGATLEPGEPLPSGFNASTYAASAWWGLQLAASEPTWYEVSTVGSSFNTVLSVWTGDSYASAFTLVHANDEASEGSVSRVRFLANPEVVYKVSVAGKGAGQEGSIAVRASSLGSPPFAEITSASFSSASVNASDVDAPVSLTLNIKAGGEMGTGLFTLFSPTGTVVLTRPFSAANRTGGVVAEGTYRIDATIPQGSAAGDYRWSLNMVRQNNTSNTISYGWEGLAPLPSAAAKFLTVQPPSTYSVWRIANNLSGLSSGPQGDFDQDGIVNLVEFAFGMDPRQAARPVLRATASGISQIGLPNVTSIGTGNQRRLRVEFLRRVGDSTVTYQVQFSSDLITWTNATQTPTVITSNTALQAVAVEDVPSTPAKSRRYARVQIRQ